jgi:Topoisomerase DNA binding C4 zinc finger
VSNLDLEQGVCFLQTDDDCTDDLMRVPQAVEIRPRCTMHGGSTIRQTEASGNEAVSTSVSDEAVEPEFDDDELEAELCPSCGEELVLKRSRSGPMMVCTTYPKCKFARHA